MLLKVIKVIIIKKRKLKIKKIKINQQIQVLKNQRNQKFLSPIVVEQMMMMILHSQKEMMFYFFRIMFFNSSSLTPVKFTVEPIPYKAVILICSHMHRDKRCGVTAPLLKEEFDKILKSKSLDVESRAGNNDGIAVYMTSHIGGHKFAGNVVVYREGRGIWYGRVIPCHVKSIIENTVIEGKIIRELYRGSIMNNFVQDESEVEQNNQI
ncbi:Sucrase/ferredoxin-like-domain-containing protein [Glomus cerebriforme]|uniref:Sucrase/ferredoxin-like-domain-containing protein n=1 Tax=Glomus cerebriforme TaxID=658196 RepID=A0A397SNU8_9GLOM|nr:Sucrase/ferredoxin-like-domain-containing protein [Glomus cerebriforme]